MTLVGVIIFMLGDGTGDLMKKLLFALLLVFSSFSQAAVSLDFRSVSVVALAQAVYRDMLGRDLVVSPDVLKIVEPVSVSVKKIELSEVPALIERVLSASKVRVEDLRGVVYLSRFDGVSAAPGSALAPVLEAPVMPVPDLAQLAFDALGDDVTAYAPRARPASYLAGVLSSLRLSHPHVDGRDVVLIAASGERHAKAVQLLGQLDRLAGSLVMRAAVVEMTDSSDDSFNLASVFKLLDAKLTVQVNGGRTGANYLRLESSSVNALLSMMRNDSRFELKSTPVVRVHHGKETMLSVGSSVPVRSGVTYVNGGAVVDNFEYKDSGLRLSVLPEIYQDSIGVQLKHEISSFVDTASSSIDSPTLNRRALETFVVTKPGDVVVMAGLEEESISNGASGLSFLPFNFGRNSSNRNSKILLLLEFESI